MNIRIYVVSGPVDESKNRLPDILCVIQVFINLLHFPADIFLSIVLFNFHSFHFFLSFFFAENSFNVILLLSEKFNSSIPSPSYDAQTRHV